MPFIVDYMPENRDAWVLNKCLIAAAYIHTEGKREGERRRERKTEGEGKRGKRAKERKHAL